MHRCRVCSVLMKNNLSKSVVALQHPFLSKCHLQRGSLLTHYCSKATELRNCLRQLNEVPIMIAMIKFPPWCSNKSSAHLTPPFNLHCLPEKRAKSLFSPIRLFLIDLDFTLFRTFMVLFWYRQRHCCAFFSWHGDTACRSRWICLCSQLKELMYHQLIMRTLTSVNSVESISWHFYTTTYVSLPIYFNEKSKIPCTVFFSNKQKAVMYSANLIVYNCV